MGGRETPVASFVIVTRASGTTAPCESVAGPDIRPTMSCAMVKSPVPISANSNAMTTAMGRVIGAELRRRIAKIIETYRFFGGARIILGSARLAWMVLLVISMYPLSVLRQHLRIRPRNGWSCLLVVE